MGSLTGIVQKALRLAQRVAQDGDRQPPAPAHGQQCLAKRSDVTIKLLRVSIGFWSRVALTGTAGARFILRDLARIAEFINIKTKHFGADAEAFS